ncbi:unnamed protein product [Blumeria hordei]|uniref:Uncharacterized protein n=2 Tax=Blumeria hordei TaxID=2867405 RepID=A0A383V2B8_BLUHO|nr:4-hydroxybenzoyl-CoA thioesterase [Blumeria hordei DH14]SZF06287.1 unnamed protein product [Blumeria hordei]
MAFTSRLPFLPLPVISSVVVAVGASHIKVPQLLASLLSGQGRYSRAVAAILIFANLKNLPFIWHLRVWSAILRHCYINKPKVPPALAPSTLFLPVITASRSPLLECDYNLHKSNSSYFSDLDVTRSHIICALLEPGIRKTKNNNTERLVLTPQGEPVQGRWSVILGATACNFKREIGIYEPYEMWSRLLCWDRKWLYFVTHFVKRGTVKPSSYIHTDGSWLRKGYQTRKGEGKDDEDVDERAIFASAISKYVVKIGRLTVHPEVILAASNLLPPRPGGWHTMTSPPSVITSSDAMEFVDVDGPDCEWRRVEERNKRGLMYAEHFHALEGLNQEFSGSKGPALGKYADLFR